MGCARLRPDGFAGYRSDADRDGEVITRPFACPGGELLLNLDAPRGAVVVEAVDESGAVLATSARVSGDGIALPVRWERGSLDRHVGRPLRLRFVLTSAQLFAFQFSTDRSEEERS